MRKKLFKKGKSMSNFNFGLDEMDSHTDEDFFSSLQNQTKTLNQLFNKELQTADEKQLSLKYQPPKVNTLTKQTQNYDHKITTKALVWTTLIAKVVIAYKQNESPPIKVGMALLATVNDVEECKLILYKSKTQILETLILRGNDKQLYKQNGGFLQFFNQHHECWTVQFESLKDEDEFREKLLTKGYKINEKEKHFLESIKSNDLGSSCQPAGEERELKSGENRNKNDTKQVLIKRMAKMGRPLPVLKASTKDNHVTTTDFSDSSDTEVVQMPIKPMVQPRNAKISSFYNNNTQLVPTTASSSSSAAAPMIVSMPQLESQYIPMLLTEQRTQNTELRMNVNKLEQKIEKVLDKLELMQSKGEGIGIGPERKQRDDEIIELEEKMLMLKKENRKLNLILQDYKENLNDSESLKCIKKELEHQEGFLNEHNIKMSSDVKTIILELINNLKKLEMNLKENNRTLQSSQQEQQNLAKELENNKITEEQLKNELKTCTEENIKLQQQREQQTEKMKQELSTKMKTIINNVYLDISNKLQTELSTNETDRILNILASAFKEHTLKSLQQLINNENVKN